MLRPYDLFALKENEWKIKHTTTFVRTHLTRTQPQHRITPHSPPFFHTVFFLLSHHAGNPTHACKHHHQQEPLVNRTKEKGSLPALILWFNTFPPCWLSREKKTSPNLTTPKENVTGRNCNPRARAFAVIHDQTDLDHAVCDTDFILSSETEMAVGLKF